MEKLIALTNIYFKGRQYVAGEIIYSDNREMSEAWKRAGSVKAAEGSPDSKIINKKTQTPKTVEGRKKKNDI